MEILTAQKEIFVLQNNRAGIERTNQALIDALRHELEDSKHFWGDYVAYNNQQHELQQLRSQKKDWIRNLIVLSVFILAILLAGVYIVILYRKLLTSSHKQQQLSSEIQSKNVYLQKEDEFKASLVSMIAHDFRAPLATTLSLIDMLKENEFSKEDLEIFYDSIQGDIRTTLSIFENILNWIKIQYSGFDYQSEPLPISQLIDEATELYRHLLTEKNLTVLNQVPADFVLQSDKEIIQFINRNLIQMH